MTRETDRMEDVIRSMCNDEFTAPRDTRPRLMDCTAETSDALVLVEYGADKQTEEVISCRNPVEARL